MSKQDEYRRNAERAQEMAERFGSAEDRAAWLRVAAGWLSLLRQARPGNGNGHEHFDARSRPLATEPQNSRRTH